MDTGIFLLAQIPPLLYATTNLIDKNLLSKYFKEGGVLTLVIFSAIASVLVLPVALFFDADVFSFSTSNILVMAGVSVINTILIWAYLKALEQDDPTVVIICYQTVPIFTFIGGYYVLGETLTTEQVLAMGVIMFGTLVAAFDIGSQTGLRLRWKTLLLMTIACVCWASEIVIFKWVAIDETAWPAIFWTNVAQCLIGLVLLVLLRSQRETFVQKFRSSGIRIFALNTANEALYLTGNTISYLVAMNTAVVFVMLAQTFQAIYVFILGILATLLFKSLHKEEYSKLAVASKVVAITITGIGSYMLLSV